MSGEHRCWIFLFLILFSLSPKKKMQLRYITLFSIFFQLFYLLNFMFITCNDIIPNSGVTAYQVAQVLFAVTVFSVAIYYYNKGSGSEFAPLPASSGTLIPDNFLEQVNAASKYIPFPKLSTEVFGEVVTLANSGYVSTLPQFEETGYILHSLSLLQHTLDYVAPTQSRFQDISPIANLLHRTLAYVNIKPNFVSSSPSHNPLITLVWLGYGIILYTQPMLVTVLDCLQTVDFFCWATYLAEGGELSDSVRLEIYARLANLPPHLMILAMTHINLGANSPSL